MSDVVNSRHKFVMPAATALALIISGCSITGNTLPELESGEKIVTGSVTKPVRPDGIAGTDAEIIKTTVVSNETASDTSPLAWSNPETGSSGAIVAIDTFMGKHGQRCKGFKTRVATFTGISFYNGETCQIGTKEWVLSWFKAVN